MGNAPDKASRETVASKHLFNTQDEKVITDILGPGYTRYTARRILEEAEKKQLRKTAQHKEESKKWIHSEWGVKAGLKIEQVVEEEPTLFIPEKKEAVVETVAPPTPPPPTPAPEKPTVELCIVEGDNESAVLYIQQPTSSMFKPSSKAGSEGLFSTVSDRGSEPQHSDDEVEGGGFMRIADEDD